MHKELKDCGVGHVFVVSLFQIQLHDDGLRFAAAAAAAIVIILFPPTMVVVFYSVRFCHCWRVYFIFGANGNPLLVENSYVAWIYNRKTVMAAAVAEEK